MSLKHTLAHHPLAFSFPVQWPLGGKTARAEEEITRLFAGLAQVKPLEYEEWEEICEVVSRHFQAHHTLAGLSVRMLKQVPWFLFETCADGSKLADDPGFCLTWRSWFASRPNTSTLLALLHSLLLHTPEEEQFNFWRGEIERRLAQGDQPHLSIWRERCARFKLLDPQGSMEFAVMLYMGKGSLHSLCQQAGLGGDLADGGFVRRSLAHLLTLLNRYADQDGLQPSQLKAVLNGLRDQEGRFQQVVVGFATQLAEVLLRPFQNREADNKWRNLLRDFLVSFLGDPRTHPAAWHDVDPEARAVILTWLAGRPERVDDKLWLFVQEANEQLAVLEADLYHLKNHSETTDDTVLRRIMQCLRAIKGVAEFFNLSEVVDVSQTMEAVFGGIRNKTISFSPELVNRLIKNHGELRDLFNDLPGALFRKM